MPCTYVDHEPPITPPPPIARLYRIGDAGRLYLEDRIANRHALLTPDTDPAAVIKSVKLGGARKLELEPELELALAQEWQDGPAPANWRDCIDAVYPRVWWFWQQ